MVKVDGYHAHLQTRSFDFDAYETSESLAREVLIATMRRHAVQVEIDPDKFIADYEDSIGVDAFGMGKGYRDGRYL